MISKGSRVFQFCVAPFVFFLVCYFYPFWLGLAWGGICARFICSVWEEQSAFCLRLFAYHYQHFQRLYYIYYRYIYTYLLSLQLLSCLVHRLVRWSLYLLLLAVVLLHVPEHEARLVIFYIYFSAS